MGETDKLKALVQLIGTQQSYSCNGKTQYPHFTVNVVLNLVAFVSPIVKIRGTLDSAALEELKAIHSARELVDETMLVQNRLIGEFKFPQPADLSKANNWTYATYVYGTLLQIFDELARHEEFPLTVNDAKKVHVGLRKAIEYGLKPFLLSISSAIDECIPHIIANVNILWHIASNQHFAVVCTRSDQHLIHTDLLSSVLMVLSCSPVDDIRSEFQVRLETMQQKIPHADYFKILFLIQGNGKNQQYQLIQQTVHRQLMETLHKPGSFRALCEALLPAITSLDQDEEIVKKRLHSSAVIATIVGRRGHRKTFYHAIIDEIQQHIMSYVRSNRTNQLDYTDVGVRCLGKLCSLRLGFVDRHIIDNILGLFKTLSAPDDLLAGAIVCESLAFVEGVRLVHLTFYATGPSDDTLPSDMLTPFMPMFFQIHHILSESTDKVLKNQVLAIITRCLSNRSKDELNGIVETILYENYGQNDGYLHPRLRIERRLVGDSEEFLVKIASVDADDQNALNDLDVAALLRSSTTLVSYLKQCNHNVLIYNVFIHLLQMFAANFGTSKTIASSSSSELLDTDADLSTVIQTKFRKEYSIIHTLNELVMFKAFHALVTENPHDITTMLDQMLGQQIQNIEILKQTKQRDSLRSTEEVLLVILSIVGDLMQRLHNEELEKRLMHTLRALKTILIGCDMDAVCRKIDFTIEPNASTDVSSEFTVAKAILSESHAEPYTKVYAIMNILKLIERRDEETLMNAHTVLALAMRMLREEDSYIFLNCIKLLIVLFNTLNETVLDALIAEYHFDIDSDAAQIDYKLKVGETIVKVTQGLGDMCYNYKAVLINCFLRGAYSQNDEFRTSNMSNLGVILRILSYQVHHFFQEVWMRPVCSKFP